MGHSPIYDPAYGQKKKLEQGRAVIPSRCGLVAEFAASPELFPVSQSGNGLRQSLNHRLARILRDRDSTYGLGIATDLGGRGRSPNGVTVGRFRRPLGPGSRAIARFSKSKLYPIPAKRGSFRCPKFLSLQRSIT